MAGESEIQESVQRIRLMEAQISSLQQQAVAISNALGEIGTTRATLGAMRGLKKESEALLPLGSGIFVHGTMGKQDKVLVDVGAGIVMEKDLEEASKILDSREADARKNLEAIQSLVSNIEKQYMETGKKLKELTGR